MTDADDGEWWLAGDGQWHEGTPPSGWVQAGDRRWYPYDPPESAEGYARKIEAARGRTATVLALDAADCDDTGEGDDLAWSYDDPGWDDDDGDDDGEGEPRRPAWVLVGVLVALLVSVVGVVAVMAQTDSGTDGEAGPTVHTVPPTSAAPGSTTTATPTTVAPAVPPLSTSSTTDAPRPSTTVTPRPSTTVPPPDTTIAPPSTTPNPAGPPVREGGRCSDAGATAVTSNGTPVTCTTTNCDGDQTGLRWRRTNC